MPEVELKEPVVLILLVAAETIGIMAFSFSVENPEALAAVMIIGINASGSPRIKLSMSIPTNYKMGKPATVA